MNPKLSKGLRIFLGLSMFVFGLNKFVLLIELAAPPPDAGEFYGALDATGYMITLIGLTEAAVGLMLTTAGMGGEFSRGETLLLFVPKETVMIFPLWASIVLILLGIVILSKSAIEHRS